MAEPLPKPLPKNGGDPAVRGSLTVHDRVAERIATRAALDTAGVRSRSSGLDRVTGRSTPRTRVSIAGGRVRASVDVAVPWSYQLSTVGAAVRGNVTWALAQLAGLHVDGVDVAVEVVARDATAARRVR